MSEVVVIAVIPDDGNRTEHLAQWFPVFEFLDQVHPVGLVVSDPRSTAVNRELTEAARDAGVIVL